MGILREIAADECESAAQIIYREHVRLLGVGDPALLEAMRVVREYLEDRAHLLRCREGR